MILSSGTRTRPVRLRGFTFALVLLSTCACTDCVEHKVTAQAGGEAVLPCTCPPGQPPYLVWQKAVGEQPLVVYNYREEGVKDDRAEEYRNRTEVTLTENCSLNILNVTPSDQGLYQCYYQRGPLRQDNISLLVTDCVEHKVTAQAGGEAVLPCTCPPDQPPYLVWQKAVGEQPLVVYNYREEGVKDDRAEEYRNRTEVTLTENCSLKILNVTPSDQGLYQCYYQRRPIQKDDISLLVTEIQPAPEKTWNAEKTVVTSSVCGLVVIVIITAAAAVYVGISRKKRRQINGGFTATLTRSI